MATFIKQFVILTMLACPIPVLGAELRTSAEEARAAVGARER